jgi:hypothetical protein
MKKNFTRFFALMASVVVPAMAMAELAYNVPFSEADWNDETTIVADKGDNEWSSKHGICKFYARAYAHIINRCSVFHKK